MRARARGLHSFAMLGLLTSGPWLSSECSAQTQTASEPVRRLDTRFSEEIGVQAPVIFTPENLGPINPGGFTPVQGARGLYAAVDLTREYDDNVLRQNNQTIGDDRYILAPLVGYEGELGRHTYELSYSGSYVSYRSLNSENNRNHVFRVRHNSA